MSNDPWRAGAAWLDGRFMPLAEAKIPVTDWGYRRSDVTYDVVSVWNGAFFRLDDHLRRFAASMAHFRLQPRETIEEWRGILHELVRRAGLREAYVAMDCLRAAAPPGLARHPVNARSYLLAFAVPYVWLMPPEVIARGAHLMIAKVRRIPASSVDPRAKNFHWADMTEALFEASDTGADNPILLDLDGNVTEGPGFNVFAVNSGKIATPDRGVLEGITRLSVLELAERLNLPCEVRPISADELRMADEVFISSTAGGIIGATRLDGRILGNDRPGPITERLHEAYWQSRRAGWHAEAVDYTPAAAE
ncbi:MAG: aminotransferase class IV [Acetobacteraceae bacterium]